MPFWNRGGSEEKSKGETNYASDDLSSFSSSDTNFAAGGAGGSDDPMMSAATGLGDMQQFSMALRQQMMVQTVINTLSDKVWMYVFIMLLCNII